MLDQRLLWQLLAPRSISLLTAMLAVFKAGGAYLPLDPRHPAARHVEVLTPSRASLFLVEEELRASGGPGARTDSGHAGYQLEQALEFAAGSNNIAFAQRSAKPASVIFTSGSTGQPKGAMIEQRGMINHLYIKVRDLELTSTDIVAQTASPVF